MQTFTIDCDGNITAFASQKEAQAADVAGAEYFGSQEELAKLAAAWPGSRLVEIWNGLPGVVPVKKFTDRKTAVARIWRAAQALTPPGAPQGAQDAPKAAKATKKATRRQKGAAAREGAAREGSKKAQVLELLRRPKGATLAEIQSLTRWAPHTIRGLVSTLGKKMKVESFKTPDGERAYRLS
jgi:hypothetical protein